jgi:hypothetical protein
LLLAHEPARLRSDATCSNRDAVPGMLVVCAQRSHEPYTSR